MRDGTRGLRKAIEALEIYTTYVPDEAKSWALLGIAQVKSGVDPEEALESLETSLEISPEQSEAYYYRGNLYLEVGEGQKAVNDFVILRRLDRKSFAASLGLARALSATGRSNDAVADECHPGTSPDRPERPPKLLLARPKSWKLPVKVPTQSETGSIVGTAEMQGPRMERRLQKSITRSG